MMAKAMAFRVSMVCSITRSECSKWVLMKNKIDNYDDFRVKNTKPHDGEGGKGADILVCFIDKDDAVTGERATLEDIFKHLRGLQTIE